MLKRKILADLLSWKSRDDKMALLIKGARQVGKTYIVDYFARHNYEQYLYLNFVENPAYKEIFSGDLAVDTLIKQITLRVPGAHLIPGKTIIVLDEIQECGAAQTALKFFSLDKRFDVVATGSLLGINYRETTSFPVGYVDHLELSSLDFEEFLWAQGILPESIADIKHYFETKTQVPQAMHTKMLELFKEYIVIGGMPRAVAQFIAHHDFAEVLRIQEGIIADYLSDIALYAKDSEKAKARACFLSIPKQLSKDYKKFQYSLVEKNGTSRKFAGSLMWLFDAGIINFCYNLATPKLPLEGNAQQEVFKVYMRDTGLLMSMLEEGSQADIIDGNLGIYKGAIYENIVADIFGKSGKKLYYYSYRSELEIDFFIRRNRTATAVEVKSSDNTKSKSLKSVMENHGVTHGIKLSTKNVGSTDQIESYPLYMAPFL
jgi:predicted AAA+ superfamily ATPase